MLVNIGADTSALERDFGRAQKVIADAAARMERTARRIGEGFGAMGRKAVEAAKSFVSFGNALSVARGLGQLVGQSLDAADAIAKIAREIGISTTALQEWRFVALRAGVSAETMDNGLRSLSNRLRSTSEDGAKFRAEFENIGVKLKNTDGSTKEVGKSIDLVLGSIREAGTAIERTSKSTKTFGSVAADMAKVADLGGERIAEFRRQANAFGIVIDEKLLRSAESAKRKLDNLSNVLKRLCKFYYSASFSTTRRATADPFSVKEASIVFSLASR